MESRLALMFAAMLLSTAAGTYVTHHVWQCTNRKCNVLMYYSGMPIRAQTIHKSMLHNIFSHATAVLYVPAIGYHHTKERHRSWSFLCTTELRGVAIYCSISVYTCTFTYENSFQPQTLVHCI